MIPVNKSQKALIIILAMSTSIAGADEYAILYTNQVNNVDDIYLATPDGVHRNITKHSRKDSSPVLSPDGRFLLFTSERVGWWKIWKMDLLDKSVTQLTHSNSAEYAPCWSPDGREIAFVSSRDGNAEIYLMQSDGSNQRNISHTRTDDATPYWHDDGRIYFSSEIDGVLQIVSIAPKGSDRKVLTNGASSKLMPQVSPAGDAILYYSEIDNNVDIYYLDIAAGNAKRLTTDPLLDLRARWSPDGEQIVFERGDKRRNQHIFVMDRNGENQRKITTDGYNYSASFVADCTILCR